MRRNDDVEGKHFGGFNFWVEDRAFLCLAVGLVTVGLIGGQIRW